RAARVAERRNVRVLAGSEPARRDGVSAAARAPRPRVWEAGTRSGIRDRRVDVRLRIVVDALRLGGLRTATVSAMGAAARAAGARGVRRGAPPGRRLAPASLVETRARVRDGVRAHAPARRRTVAAALDGRLLRPAESTV